MGTKKVTVLTAATDVTDADLFYLIDGTTSKKVTGSVVKTYMSSGIAGTYTALSAAPIVGATTISVDNVPSGLTSDLLWVVIDMGTSECEVRKVTTVSGTTCTVVALQYAHAIDDPVFLTWNPDIYVEWFGAQGDGTTDDTTALTRAIVQATRPLNNHRVVRLPGNEYLVTSTIAIAAYGLVLIGARTRRPISEGSDPVGATRINFTGSGALFQIGTDSGNPHDTGEYDGYHGWTMRDLAIKFTGTTDTALNNGEGDYKANTIGIKDWRGGEVNLDNVWIESFHYGFWGIQSDQNNWNNVMLRYNKVGAYLGPRSDQLTAVHLGSLKNDTVLHLDRVAGHNYYGGYFVGDGSATDYPIKIGTAWAIGSRGVNFNGCWFEHYSGYSEIEAFCSIGKGDSVDSIDVTFRDCFVFTNPVATPRAKYLVEVDKCDGILINQLGGVPDNLTNIVSYVDGTSHVTVVANRDYMLPIAYDDNSGGAATPLLSQNTIGAMRSTFDLWFQDNVAATQTDVALTRADHVGSAPDAYIDKLILGRPGRVRFIYVKLNANQSAGSLTITLTIDGVAQAMTAAISSAVAFAVSATDAIATTAGNQLGITITTTGTWAPTTADLRAGMIVETF